MKSSYAAEVGIDITFSNHIGNYKCLTQNSICLTDFEYSQDLQMKVYYHSYSHFLHYFFFLPVAFT
jgi:hypothetical protein